MMGTLAFLYPAFLIGAALAAVPIILHLLRKESAPAVPFSAVKFLKVEPIEQRRRRRLRELFLLAMRVAALLLLAFAFARPYLRAADGLESHVTMVAVDTSYTMDAPGQFEGARQAALAAIDQVPAGSPVGIVRFDDQAAVVLEPTVDRGAARAAVDRLSAGFGAPQYATALSRAAEAIRSRNGRIVVVTSLSWSGWDSGEGLLPERIVLDVVAVPPPAGNLAVTRLQVDGGEAVATLAAYGLAPQTTRARLVVDDQTVLEVPVTIEPAVSTEVRFAHPLPATGTLAVSVEDPEGYPADDHRYLVLGSPDSTPLLVVTASGRTAHEAFYLERALQVGDISRFQVRTIAGSDLAGLSQDELGRAAAVFLLATRAVDRSGRDALVAYVRRGGGLLVAAGAEVDPAVLTGLFGSRPALRVSGDPAEPADLSVTPVDIRHPVFRPMGPLAGNLGQVRFTRAMRFEAPDARVIARFSSGAPALMEMAVEAGRVLLFASDLNNRWNDFPLHPMYVPFVHELGRYLSRDREHPREYLIADLPEEVRRVPGVVGMDDGARRVAVNVDARAADPTPLTVEEFRASVRTEETPASTAGIAEVSEREASQNFWRYGLMLMLVALACEGFLGRRGA
jgi:hypothetical protein